MLMLMLMPFPPPSRSPSLMSPRHVPVLVAMFAGYGGTGSLCKYSTLQLLKDPAR